MATDDTKITADRGRTFSALWSLWPYLWPADRADLKLRVVIAFVALVAAKVVGVLVPYSFKWATDALTGQATPPSYIPLLIAGPVALVLAYNIGRFVTTGFSQIRDALFARVGLHAVRQLAYRTFRHLHDLSLRFHLERRTGGLSRVIERGTNGIENIVRHVILNTAPTVLEFALTAGIVLVPVRVLVRGRHRRDGVSLCLVYDPGERLADQHPPRDERLRH